MIGQIVRCDQCGAEQTIFTQTFGGINRNWISVSRQSSMSGDVIGAGIHHFCDEKCLSAYLAVQP